MLQQLKTRAEETLHVRFEEMFCDESAQRTEGQGEVHFIAEQGAFGRLREVMVVMEVGEAPGFLAVLKEMGRVERSDEGMVALRKAEEPALPMHPAAEGDTSARWEWLEAEGLMHQLNIGGEREDAVDRRPDEDAVLKNRFVHGSHEDGMHDILCGRER